jgi:Domain of unknown function (DUF4276)
MATIAFIVEGNCEQRAIQKICPGMKVITLGLNGRDVSISAMARQIAAVTRVFSNRYYPIVVLFDREQRVESANDITSQINSSLEELGLDKHQFIIGIADRKIENWMIPFIDSCYGDAKGNAVAIPYTEGTNDVGRLKSALRERNISYHKTTVGAHLLSSIKPETLAAKSKSFAMFRNQLLDHCIWMEF